MKCIKWNGGTIARLTDWQAKRLVEEEKAVYISKKEWKRRKKEASK